MKKLLITMFIAFFPILSLAGELTPQKVYTSQGIDPVKWTELKEKQTPGKIVLMDLGKDVYIKSLSLPAGESGSKVYLFPGDPFVFMKKPAEWGKAYRGKVEKNLYVIEPEYALARFVVVEGSKQPEQAIKRLSVTAAVPDTVVDGFEIKTSTNNADISFRTNIAVNSQMVFDTAEKIRATGAIQQVRAGTGFSKSHAYELTGLKSSTEYWIVFHFTDVAGTIKESSIYKINTK